MTGFQNDNALPPGAAADAADRLLTLAIVHVLQKHTGVAHRARIGAILAQVIAEVTRHSGIANAAPDAAATAMAGRLRDEGYARLGSVLDAAQTQEVVGHFKSLPCYNAHVTALADGTGRRLGEGAEAFHYGSYRLADLVAAPHLLELANRPDILAAAEDYLGCVPTLYSIHAWWTFPGHGKAQYSQDFHRDLDDYRFCTMFVYLTEVGAQTGPHAYVRRSHRPELVDAIIREAAARLTQAGYRFTTADFYKDDQGYGLDEIYTLLFEGLIDTITGPAGTAFIADTTGLHKGIPATAGPRLMFWARYGLYRNHATHADGTEAVPRRLVGNRLPGDARSAYINRCIVMPT